MPRVSVTVMGPGTCINAEMEIIRRALVAYGFNVDVINAYPLADSPEEVEKYLDHIKKDAKVWNIELIAEHLPWGG